MPHVSVQFARQTLTATIHALAGDSISVYRAQALVTSRQTLAKTL